jgi:hypothetical protein
MLRNSNSHVSTILLIVTLLIEANTILKKLAIKGG